jgi:predicted amidohydrolase
MNLACCQLDIAWEDKAANYRRAEDLVGAADLAPGTLLLLPEMFATGFTMNAGQVAEPPDGPTARFAAALARRHAIYVVAGAVVRGQGEDRPRNEALAFDPAGQTLGRYAKIHLFSFAGEDRHYAPGNGLLRFAWEGTTVALSICYDLRFPELYRAAALSGAEVLAVIACWPAAREEHWLALLRARAIENQCYVAAVNRVGREPSGLAYSGRSLIIGPRGNLLGDAANAETVIQAPADLDALRRYRREFPALDDARPIPPDGPS